MELLRGAPSPSFRGVLRRLHRIEIDIVDPRGAAHRCEEVGTGSAVPTQLVLVPMLALLPVQDVPLCVVTGLLLGGLPDYARGRVPIARSILRLVNSWHAVGPALVLI